MGSEFLLGLPGLSFFLRLSASSTTHVHIAAQREALSFPVNITLQIAEYFSDATLATEWTFAQEYTLRKRYV